MDEKIEGVFTELLKTASPNAVIEYVNHFTQDEAKRCRLLLAALLYRIS